MSHAGGDTPVRASTPPLTIALVLESELTPFPLLEDPYLLENGQVGLKGQCSQDHSVVWCGV
eukprot:9132481-Prorocentrum_lima.AAC.1